MTNQFDHCLPERGAFPVTLPSTSIRLIDVADASVIADHLARDADEFARWLPARPDGFHTTPGQVDRIEQLLEDQRKGERWPGVIMADDVVIGQVTVSTIVRGPIQKGFLSYWVASRFQGQGHASRAVGLALRVMTEDLGLNRAEAHTQMENLSSHRVLRSNGFTPWGIASAHIYINGSWRDEVFWERRLSDASPG
ncbi:GNAT family N-acetyltransferase [Actinoallomurus soli]|uniref:GNAT family N-acetyltransferase n=1 Tax=Actinoallomurus soli TaxID=2952535 RepID=UPI0020933A62|nr:GNAT family protein [Actinoallomurus soli]MCO5970223.1 GNAT family N-acetyltransferase [Actinoallomurus soli]